MICSGAVVEPVLALEFGGDRLAQRRGAGDGGVFGLAPVDRGLGRLLDIVRRVEIGLAGAKADDVAAGRLQLGGLLVTAMVGDGLISDRRWARNDIGFPSGNKATGAEGNARRRGAQGRPQNCSVG